MLSLNYSKDFYDMLMNMLRDNANDSELPAEEVDKANKLLYLLARKAVQTKDEDGVPSMQITWYERTCCDLAMQAMYSIRRDNEEKSQLIKEIAELKAELAKLKESS